MINIYAYTYPAAAKEFADSGYTLLKLGDSHRDTLVRIKEQGNSSEWQGKIIIGSWNNLQRVRRDHDLHAVLTERGLWHSGEHQGTEWFRIPGRDIKEARAYIDQLIADFEGQRVRPRVKLRDLQQRALDQAIDLIERGSATPSIIANLCPRFGKTIWALSLFNEIYHRWGNRVMLLPAYWLSVHTSFVKELGDYADFQDIQQIDPQSGDAELQCQMAIEAGQRVLIPLSLHGDYEEWCRKHDWIAAIPNEEIFMFADEGDFGTHTENQVAKLDFLFN